MSRTRESIADAYGPIETVTESEHYEVVEDVDGDYWIGRHNTLSDEDYIMVGSGYKEDLTAALRDAGLLEDAEARESGAERFEDAREWYDALRDAADETFGEDWYAVGFPEEDIGPDYDVVVTASTSARVRDGPFFDLFGDSIAYLKADPMDGEDEGVVEPETGGMNEPAAFYLDTPEHVDVETLEEDPSPSPEDVAETWYALHDQDGNVAHAPVNEETEFSHRGGSYNPIKVTSPDLNRHGVGTGDDWAAERVEAVEASEVPTDE